MISKNKIKLIKSLNLKKFRQKEQLFLVEGDKNVLEVMDSQYQVNELYATGEFLETNKKSAILSQSIFEVNKDDIKKISLLSQPQNAVALCSIPPPEETIFSLNSLSLFLDDVQDPGNLGTILRICDWFGMDFLFCSPSTVDVYNPKVIQASMGSFCRVKTIYLPFANLLNTANEMDFPVFATFPEGENIYKKILPEKALVVLGNDGNGISAEVAEKVNARLSIPSFRNTTNGAESLNVAISAGIICSEFKRRKFDNPTQSGNRG
jgi:TrmH family RNA methyltransferase